MQDESRNRRKEAWGGRVDDRVECRCLCVQCRGCLGGEDDLRVNLRARVLRHAVLFLTVVLVLWHMNS
ncbi:hypothetical protein BC827DRAFT_1194370 [Russula dissimulans]|nr:hypothetical protein BC827DRAFT_1194370 [Russula dissimulans]